MGAVTEILLAEVLNNNTRMMLWPLAIQLTGYLHHVLGLYSATTSIPNRQARAVLTCASMLRQTIAPFVGRRSAWIRMDKRSSQLARVSLSIFTILDGLAKKRHGGRAMLRVDEHSAG